MSTIITTTVKTEPTTDTLTLGGTGDSIVISGDSLNMNTLQDAGGNTTFVSDGSGTLTSQNMPGALTLISTQTASGAASINFTTGLDSTYDIYIFKYININPATDGSKYEFQCSTDGGMNYDITMTTTSFETYHDAAISSTFLSGQIILGKFPKIFLYIFMFSMLCHAGLLSITTEQSVSSS